MQIQTPSIVLPVAWSYDHGVAWSDPVRPDQEVTKRQPMGVPTPIFHGTVTPEGSSLRWDVAMSRDESDDSCVVLFTGTEQTTDEAIRKCMRCLLLLAAGTVL